MSEPQPPYGQQPPPYGYPPPYAAPPTSSKATTSLVLGIASLVLCGVFTGIPAMVLARQGKREIRESGGRVSGDGLATAGFVLGLIGTAISVLMVLLVVAVFVFGGVLSGSFVQSCTVTSGDPTADCS